MDCKKECCAVFTKKGVVMDNNLEVDDFKNRIHNLEQRISDERMRFSTDRMDISFGELISMYKVGELVIRPEYQRLFRWKSPQKTAFIESILLGIPIPPIFVTEDEDGVWELIDGLQRVSTIISFFGDLDESLLTERFDDSIEDGENHVNKWKLESGNLIEDLEGFNVDTLPKRCVINLKRAVCRVQILHTNSDTTMRYELFKRLNSGGFTLTPKKVGFEWNEIDLEYIQGYIKYFRGLGYLKV